MLAWLLIHTAVTALLGVFVLAAGRYFRLAPAPATVVQPVTTYRAVTTYQPVTTYRAVDAKTAAGDSERDKKLKELKKKVEQLLKEMEELGGPKAGGAAVEAQAATPRPAPTA